jgi:hypothetical protein
MDPLKIKPNARWRFWQTLMVITLTIFWMGACEVNGYQVTATPTASLVATPALDVYIFGGTFVPTPSLPPTAYAVASQLQHRWLNGLPCRLPCWEGITPGKTSATEAFDLLQSNPLIDDVNLINEKDFGEINWRWKTEDNSGGRLFFRKADQLVDAILPGIKNQIGLGDIIRAYGEPDFAWVKEIQNTNPGNVQTNIPPAYSASIIWTSPGFAVSPVITNRSDTLDQYRSAMLIVIFEPSKDGYLAYQGSSGASMIKWHGYDDVSNYLVP